MSSGPHSIKNTVRELIRIYLLGPITTGQITTSAGITLDGNLNLQGGGVYLNATGQQLRIAEGANAKQGTVALVGGTATVSTTAVTNLSRIYLTSQVDGGTPGFLRVTTITVGTSFVITSSSGTDTSTVAWVIFEG